MSKCSEVVIREDEWMAELENLGLSSSSGDSGMTSAEIQDRTGIGNHRLMRLLKAGVRKGLVSVGRGVRTNLIGVPVTVPVYTIKSAKSKKSR